jgi:hypothetical protein
MKKALKKKKNNTPAIDYIFNKFDEARLAIPGMEDFLYHGYVAIGSILGNSQVDPAFIRKVDALEAIMLSFVEHIYDEEALDRLQATLHSGGALKEILN